MSCRWTPPPGSPTTAPTGTQEVWRSGAFDKLQPSKTVLQRDHADAHGSNIVGVCRAITEDGGHVVTDFEFIDAPLTALARRLLVEGTWDAASVSVIMARDGSRDRPGTWSNAPGWGSSGTWPSSRRRRTSRRGRRYTRRQVAIPRAAGPGAYPRGEASPALSGSPPSAAPPQPSHAARTPTRPEEGTPWIFWNAATNSPTNLPAPQTSKRSSSPAPGSTPTRSSTRTPSTTGSRPKQSVERMDQILAAQDRAVPRTFPRGSASIGPPP